MVELEMNIKSHKVRMRGAIGSHSLLVLLISGNATINALLSQPFPY